VSPADNNFALDGSAGDPVATSDQRRIPAADSNKAAWGVTCKTDFRAGTNLISTADAGRRNHSTNDNPQGYFHRG